jgi:hypothetical protein
LQELRGEVGSEGSGLPEILSQATTAASKASTAVDELGSSEYGLSVIKGVITDPSTGLPKVLDVLEDDASGLPAILLQATTAASKATDALSALTAGADRLEVINEHAGNAAASSANAFEALTAGADRLAVINGHASNAAASSGEVQSAIGTDGDTAIHKTVFGRIADVRGAIGNEATLDSVRGKIKDVKDAVGSSAAGGHTGDSVQARIDSLHDELDKVDAVTPGLRQLIGTNDTTTGTVRKEIKDVKDAVGSSADGTGSGSTVFSRVADVRGAIGNESTTDSVRGKIKDVKDAIGTASPLTGIHAWMMNEAFALMIAQARADEMLDGNCTPEPARSVLRRLMTDKASSLRPDRDTSGGKAYTFRQFSNGFLYAANTHFIATTRRRSISSSVVSLNPPDTSLKQIINQHILANGAVDFLVCVGGLWTVPRYTKSARWTATCTSQTTADYFYIDGNFGRPDDADSTPVEYQDLMAYKDAFPLNIPFHVIQISC